MRRLVARSATQGENMGTIKVGNIDFNSVLVVRGLQLKIQTLLDDTRSYYDLEHTKQYYFSTQHVNLPKASGWYIILAGTIPIYVGKAINLNNRLNSEDGSRDQFANPQRTSDIERNFIKKYREAGLIPILRVCVIRHIDLFPDTQLTNLDIGNIEKFINIWRCHFKYK